MKIREIFDMYRSTSALMFIVRAEYEKLKDYKYDNPLLQQQYEVKLQLFKRAMDLFQKSFEDVREDISILIHHDAITGTSSPSAENNWLDYITKNSQIL